MTFLQVTWFFLIGVLLTVYAILDGFDLGVGIWHLFAKKDEERRALLSSIGPFWDGNEVWLLTGGGAIFAAFPHVYATVFSGLYLALMLVLFALIFRAVSVEFRSKVESVKWRTAWDTAFSIGSILPALLFGVALGNMIRGLELDASMNYVGSFFDLLNPYSLLIGLVGFAMIALHGALYIVLRLEGEIAERAKKWANISWLVYLVLFLVASLYSLIGMKERLVNYHTLPLLWIAPLFTLAMIILIKLQMKKGVFGRAFLFSSLAIAGQFGIVGSALFPNMVPSLNNPELSLTIMNASSSELTLKTMFILALVGVPVVIGYTIWVYMTFHGKVKPERSGY